MPKKPAAAPPTRWLSSTPSKAAAEAFFLRYSLYWIGVFGLVVHFTDPTFMALGLLLALPAIIYPIIFPFPEDKGIPLTERFFFKANVWIFVFSYVGNYFWTHYFYKVLHAYYTFPAQWQLNQVPIFLYFITHAYFTSYHTVTTLIQRRFWASSVFNGPLKYVAAVVLVFLLSYATALMEAVTIVSVPYYVVEDRFRFYLLGSAFYGIYFYVSFPMYLRMDEKPKDRWTLPRATFDSLAAGMLVTIILDLTRISIGHIFVDSAAAAAEGPPFIS